MSGQNELSDLANLLAERNGVDARIAAIIGRPAQAGHLGEYIASAILGIQLEASAVQAGYDGRFRDGPLAGKTVNIKMYGKREGLLDINEEHVPEFYLVLAGPKSPALTSKGSTRPFVIKEVFLFDAPALIARVRKRGVKLGVATSVISEEWETARIFPSSSKAPLALSDQQMGLLRLFDPKQTSAVR